MTKQSIVFLFLEMSLFDFNNRWDFTTTYEYKLGVRVHDIPEHTFLIQNFNGTLIDIFVSMLELRFVPDNPDDVLVVKNMLDDLANYMKSKPIVFRDSDQMTVVENPSEALAAGTVSTSTDSALGGELATVSGDFAYGDIMITSMQEKFKKYALMGFCLEQEKLFEFAFFQILQNHKKGADWQLVVIDLIKNFPNLLFLDHVKSESLKPLIQSFEKYIIEVEKHIIEVEKHVGKSVEFDFSNLSLCYVDHTTDDSVTVSETPYDEIVDRILAFEHESDKVKALINLSRTSPLDILEFFKVYKDVPENVRSKPFLALLAKFLKHSLGEILLKKFESKIIDLKMYAKIKEPMCITIYHNGKSLSELQSQLIVEMKEVLGKFNIAYKFNILQTLNVEIVNALLSKEKQALDNASMTYRLNIEKNTLEFLAFHPDSELVTTWLRDRAPELLGDIPFVVKQMSTSDRLKQKLIEYDETLRSQHLIAHYSIKDNNVGFYYAGELNEGQERLVEEFMLEFQDSDIVYEFKDIRLLVQSTEK